MITLTVECDICGQPVFSDGMPDWPSLRQALYDAGWRKVKDGWGQVCPQCMSEARREADADRIPYLTKKRRERFRDE